MHLNFGHHEDGDWFRNSMFWIRTLPRGGMYWKIHLPEPKRFPKGRDFAPRGPRKKAEDNLETRIKAVSGLEIGCIELYTSTWILKTPIAPQFQIPRQTCGKDCSSQSGNTIKVVEWEGFNIIKVVWWGGSIQLKCGPTKAKLVGEQLSNWKPSPLFPLSFP